MRQWSEEQKMGTLEILLTLPDDEARHVIAHNFKQIAQVGDERIPGYERLIERCRNPRSWTCWQSEKAHLVSLHPTGQYPPTHRPLPMSYLQS